MVGVAQPDRATAAKELTLAVASGSLAGDVLGFPFLQTQGQDALHRLLGDARNERERPQACTRWDLVMKEKHDKRSSEAGISISSQESLGGEIILRTRRRQVVFLAGLTGFVLIALVTAIAGFGG